MIEKIDFTVLPYITKYELDTEQYKTIPRLSGYYFFIDEAKVVYIGLSKYLRDRLRYHEKRYYVSETARIYWILDDNADEVGEKELIRYFRPIYNVMNKGSKRDNPDYVQICGYVPKELGNKFRGYSKIEGVEISTLLETFIQQWVETIESKGITTPNTGESEENDESTPQ
ncbi:hypothetical protein [Scytonema sp. NUACC26]|uniref:hypothetical protein n=1 Tax=Scytonema sp. NUACC26 TaxID=3140176 RepID=UPI0034DC3A2B